MVTINPSPSRRQNQSNGNQLDDKMLEGIKEIITEVDDSDVHQIADRCKDFAQALIVDIKGRLAEKIYRLKHRQNLLQSLSDEVDKARVNADALQGLIIDNCRSDERPEGAIPGPRSHYLKH